MSKILSIARKDLKLLLRDKGGFFFTFFFPFLVAVFFGVIFSGGGSGKQSAITILGVDNDRSKQSEAFLKLLNDSSELDIIPETDIELAKEKVRQGKNIAYILLKKDFGANKSNVFGGNPPEIELGIDPSRKAESGMLQGIITKYAFQGFQENFTNLDSVKQNTEKSLESIENDDTISEERKQVFRNFFGELNTFMKANQEAETEATESGTNQSESSSTFGSGFEPVKITNAEIIRERKGPMNPYEITFPQGIIWGIMSCAAAFGISLVVERTRGTLIRLRAAPIGKSHILAGKAAACFFMSVTLSMALLVFGKLVFKVTPNSMVNITVAVLGVGIAFSGVMMLLSVLGKTERSAGGIGWGVLMMMAMFGGGMIPLFFMPPWMQKLSNFSLVKWSILSFEGALWRHFTLVEMLQPFGILTVSGIVCFFIGYKLFRIEE